MHDENLLTVPVMQNKLSSVTLGVLGFLATWLGLIHLANRPDFFEPDRLFHFSLLSQLVQQHVFHLTSWAQLPLLGWQDYFSDKEFLFHLLLYYPAKFGGETAVVATVLFCSSALIWLPYFFFPASRRLALGLSMTAIVMNPYMLFRISLIRPHILAITLFLLLLLVFKSKRPVLCALFSFLFALSYHAFYLVVLVALVFHSISILTKYYDTSSEKYFCKKEVLATSFGLALGIFVNPYFPSNLVRAIQHLAIAIRPNLFAQDLQLRLGTELLPFSTAEFAYAFSGIVLAAAIAAVVFFRRMKILTQANIWANSVFFLMIIFWTLSVRSPRAVEYAVPVTVLWLALVAQPQSKKFKFALLAVILVCQLGSLRELFHNLEKPGVYHVFSPALVEKILTPIPKGKKLRIFHTNWALGPYLLYYRPQVEIIDVLDPTFLLLHSPEKALVLSLLVQGRIAQPIEKIRSEFNADYILSEPSPLGLQLRTDPKVSLINVAEDHSLALFRIKD